MSTFDLSVEDGSFYSHSFEAEPFPDPFSDSALDILQTLSDYQKSQTLVEEQPLSLEQSSPNLISSSPPPSYQSLNPYQTTRLSSVENESNFHNVLEDFSVFDNLESFEQISPNLMSSSIPSFQLESLNICQATSIGNDPNLINVFEDFSGLENFEPLEQISSNFVSYSPPSFQLESSNLYQADNLGFIENDPILENGLEDFSVLENLLAETEQCLVGFEQNAYNTHAPSFVFEPCYDPLSKSPNFQSQEASLSSPEISYLTSHMRRVSSTEDLQDVETACNPQECSAMEIARKYKTTRYTAEERKERISKYKSRKVQRNFNKTIKYVCRKKIADRRPRIGGRFVRYGQAGETIKPSCTTREEDEDDLWIERLNVDEELGEEQLLMNNDEELGDYYHF